MAGKIRHMVNRSGRYYARLVVPKEFRNIIGKSELRQPLGGDYRQALKLLPGAVAQLQSQIAYAERMKYAAASDALAPRYPMAVTPKSFFPSSRRSPSEDFKGWGSLPVSLW